MVSPFIASSQSANSSVRCKAAHSITNPSTRGGRRPTRTDRVSIAISTLYSPYQRGSAADYVHRRTWR